MITGAVINTIIAKIVTAMCKNDVASILGLINQIIAEGKEISILLSDLIIYFRNLLIYSISNQNKDLIDVSDDLYVYMNEQISLIDNQKLMLIIKDLSGLENH